MFNQGFITWSLVVVVGTYDGPCGCQSGTVKSEPVPSGKLLRKWKQIGDRLLEGYLNKKFLGSTRADTGPTNQVKVIFIKLCLSLTQISFKLKPSAKFVKIIPQHNSLFCAWTVVPGCTLHL